ncbi:MAG TPA: indole-3-glycerol phosphate synthase TrpC [Chitinophagaceae bacterium]|nr:indole-3-glycerol phosphate synthase TrpC [Chitinophagaceae bacterium]HNK61706.1 indole-3-glycerol phosphate synthase TrpC [Chitinophagaceae bacterium]HNL60402.1 indole-3-glycerol phosphate synthase TrpC [Chitinophagaceae bacterium]HNO00556.1 indole-3-glycerol phosphate synthase TrpC [Chitinophagaceae bacterium]
MSTILDKIITTKKKEIAHYQPLSPIERFEHQGFFWQIRNRSLVDHLLMPGSNGIIAEFKRKSPSKGEFKPKSLEVEDVVVQYNKRAAGISILTDENFFGGDLDDLIQAKVISDVPVLRKDFIIDKWQIAESKAFGADVVLLIAACLTPVAVKEFAGYAASIGLESILEVHNEKELEHYCDKVNMIGVNNRNLQTFEVDINTSLQLIEKIPAGVPAIAESGISDVETIKTLRNAGYRGFLIGENFMKEDNPGRAFEDFVNKLNV